MSTVKILQNHLMWALTHNCENLIFTPYENDIQKWHVLVLGLDGVNDCFKGGQFLVNFDTTKTMGPLKMSYPQEPPTFLVMTPNGKYGTDGKVCVSFGEFHNQNYQQHLGIAGFAELLIQGMVSPESMGGGIRIIDSATESEIRTLSKLSVQYNLKHFPKEMLKLYITRVLLVASKAWKIDPENTDRLIRVGDDKERKAAAKKIMGWSLDAVPAAEYAYVVDIIKKTEIAADITPEVDNMISTLVKKFKERALF